MSGRTKYVVITPARNEEEHISATIKSMAQQTLPPSQWICVDDGSSDRTGDLLDAGAEDHDWLRVLHRPDRGRREAGGGVVETFNVGLGAVTADDWQFLVKLDSDLSFDAGYFERCFAEFEEDPELGIGGGVVCDESFQIEVAGDPGFHVRGATKIYRRACWEQIGPLVQAPGWDTVDELKANQLGWRTRSFPELKLVQHRPTGAAAGSWSDSTKNGQANYVASYHPLFMFVKCVKRLPRRPYLLHALGLAAGFVGGYFGDLPRVTDPDYVSYVRDQQLRRVSFRESIWG